MKKLVIFSVINDVVFDQRVNRAARTLMQEGADVLVVGRQWNNSLPSNHLPYTVKRFRMLFNNGPLLYAFFNIRLFFFLLFRKVDILLANDLDTLLANFLVSRIKKVELVYDSHEYFTGVPEIRNRPFVRKVWQSIEKWIFPKLKHVYTVNQSLALIYEKKYKVSVKVVRNLSHKWNRSENCSRTRLGLPGNKSIIILQGSGINVDRGAEEAVLSMQYLDNTLLLVIGDGDIVGNLKQMVSELGLKSKVMFMEKVPYHILMNYTCAADIGITLDKDTNLNYKYSLPNKLFDYIQAGVPVLASKVIEIENIIKSYDIGDIIDNHDPEHIASKLKNMLSDMERMQLWKKNLHKAREELCWENEQGKIMEIFRKAGLPIES
ncbi:MAG: glycosyltransferase [Bacteroidetes bacterium]|nr:glycosyltransferase [Bacteroidota bacterium]